MDPHGTASDYFGSIAESYDSLIRGAVPRYDEMIDRILEYSPTDADRILELGAGTGNLTCRLAERYPSAMIVTVDASMEMLDTTRSRLGEHASRVEFVHARFEDTSFDDDGFDLVASCISLHHVQDKASIFAAIYRSMSPGGRLVMADQCRGATDEIHEINWRHWLEFCRLPGHCDEESVKDLVEHADAHDHYTPVGEHFALFGQVGFEPASIDCVWRNWIWAILTAQKPG